jgi:UDP-N-acetylglucosamine 2-epimerase (non-hydrolysing)
LAEEYKLPVIVSTHPRTRKRLELLTDMKMENSIHFLKPFGFIDYIFLQMNAVCVVSDSGTISEESSILNFPAISLRQSMERPEAQDSGTIILTGFDQTAVLNSIQLVIKEFENTGGYRDIAEDYKVTNTSWRVLKLISGNAKLSNLWDGIRKSK